MLACLAPLFVAKIIVPWQHKNHLQKIDRKAASNRMKKRKDSVNRNFLLYCTETTNHGPCARMTRKIEEKQTFFWPSLT